MKNLESPPLQTDEEALAEIRSNVLYYAIALMESDMNPNAENPTSTAKGLFQLILNTRKQLGVTNWKSPAQQLKALKRLVKRNSYIFKTEDPERLYAAHYLGEPTYKKVLEDLPLTEKQEEIVSYYLYKVRPRFRKILEKVKGKMAV